jgi:hypothetical protein
MPYFAYCTLLYLDEMRRFCPSATLGLVGRVSGWRVAFAAYADRNGGGCTLEPAPARAIYGVLYALSDEEFAQLDTISGVDRGIYERIDVAVTTEAGEVAVLTYRIVNPSGPFRPSPAYTRPILSGARARALPADYLAELEALVSLASDS